MHLFISYSREDRILVDRLRQDLSNAGLTIWIDKIGLQPGTPDWDEALREAIGSAQAVLYVASPSARRSLYVRDELALGRAAKKPIYPLWIAGEQWLDCVPMGYGSTQNLDLRGEQYAAGLAGLIGVLTGKEAATVLEVEAVAPAAPPAVPRNPYKGLRAFREEDQGDFFGRDLLIADLLAAIGDGRKSPRLRALLGASGSGKSSIMMAGVLPRLRAKHPDWLYLDLIVPGAQPLERLTIALARQLKRAQADIRKDLDDKSRRGLHRLASEISDKPVVLYIDQFEELFTLTTNEAERRQVVDLLTCAATEPDGILNLLLTMRADFYDRPAQYTEFGALMEAQHTLITPMRLADLYDVVLKPADLPDVQIGFDDGLVNELVSAVREEASALPLLQFTLDQLFERREGQRLTVAAYSAIGGLRGALAKHAEATYAALSSDDHRRLARALFLRLIEPGATEQDTTRRRARLSELQFTDGERSAMMQEVMRQFVEARLLTTDRAGTDETVEVSHEALIREWGRLGEWLHHAREDVVLQKKLSVDTAAWVKGNRQTDYGALYSGRVLREAQQWASHNLANADELAFLQAGAAREAQLEALEESRKRELIKASERAEASRRASVAAANRARIIFAGLMAFVILAAIVFFVANAQYTSNLELANTTLTFVGAQVVAANASLTPIPLTLTPVGVTLAAAEVRLDQAAETLIFVQDEGTSVAAQATYFGIEQARIGTLAAGAVVIPPGTLTPELLLPTLTGIARLRQWEPRIIVEDIDAVRIEMVEVPPGCFMMGSVAGGDESPVHEQCFDEPFYIDRYEVTQAQFTALNGVMAEEFAFPGENRPVENINWFEARDFCEDRRNARLPTEREWEYAARGPDSLTYPWGNLFVPENVIYNRVESQGTADVIDAVGNPTRPGGASWVGALDMSGNVWEWTNTRFDDLDYSQETFDLQGLFPYPYREDDGREANETLAEYNQRADEQSFYTLRVVRGGSWGFSGTELRGAARNRYVAGFGYNSNGFRCARSYNSGS